MSNQDQSTGKTLMRGSIIRVAASLASAISGFFMMPFLVQSLGDSQYGVWILMTTLTGAYFLVDFGLTAAVMRFVSAALGRDDIREMNRVVNTALMLYSLLGLVVLLIVGVVVWTTPYWIDHSGSVGVGDMRHALAVLGLNAAIGFPARSVAGILQARFRYDLIAAVTLIGLVVQVATTVAVVASGNGIVGMAYAVFFSGLLPHFAVLRLSRRMVPQLVFSRSFVHRELVPSLLGYSAWAFVAQVGEQLRNRADPIIIGILFSSASITAYAVGGQLVEYSLLILLQATNFMVPALTRLVVRGERESLRSALFLLIRVNIALGVFAVAGMYAFGDVFIEEWMGPQFDTAYLVLVVLLAGAVIQFITTPIENLLYAVGAHRTLGIIVICEGALKCGLAVVLGARFGLVGVAAAAALSQVLLRCTVLPILGARHLEVSFGVLALSVARVAGMAAIAGGASAWFATSVLTASNFGEILAGSLMLGAVYWPLVIVFGLRSPDRFRLLAALPFFSPKASDQRGV